VYLSFINLIIQGQISVWIFRKKNGAFFLNATLQWLQFVDCHVQSHQLSHNKFNISSHNIVTQKEVTSTKLTDISMTVTKYEDLRDLSVARSCPVDYLAFIRGRWPGKGGSPSSLQNCVNFLPPCAHCTLEISQAGSSSAYSLPEEHGNNILESFPTATLPHTGHIPGVFACFIQAHKMLSTATGKSGNKYRGCSFKKNR
jgi:hypothetical protein